jgi:modification methylase
MISQIIHNDCLDGIKTINDNSIDLIVTSPPYNKGWWSSNRNPNNGFRTKSRRIEYGTYNDKMEPKLYAEWQSKVISELIRILKPTGSIFYNTIDILNKHQCKHTQFVWDYPVKQVIIWNRKNTPKLDKSYFFPTTENIFWIQKTKDSRTYFNRNNCKFKTSVWEIPPDRKNNFPAPFPIDVPLNCIMSCCPSGGVVLDPFMGSGTTGVASKICGMNFIGIEIDKSFCSMARDRINNYQI